MPLLALGLSRAAGLPLGYAVGLCVLGSCPGGTASNVVAALARGDLALSVTVTLASTLAAVAATPLLTQAVLGAVVLLPVLAGAAINTAAPRMVRRLAPLSSLAAVALVCLVLGSVMGANRQAVLEAGPRLLAAVTALHAGGFALGYALSRLMGLPEVTARTNSIEVGMQNSALGAVLAAVHFPAHPLAAVPCAISACVQSLLGSLLAAAWRASPPAAAAAGGAAAEAAARKAEVGAWIAAHRRRSQAAGAGAGGAAMASVAETSAEEADAATRKQEVQAWIAAHRVRSASQSSLVGSLRRSAAVVAGGAAAAVATVGSAAMAAGSAAAAAVGARGTAAAEAEAAAQKQEAAAAQKQEAPGGNRSSAAGEAAGATGNGVSQQLTAAELNLLLGSASSDGFACT
eukprot:scaffold9.g3307.t1